MPKVKDYIKELEQYDPEMDVYIELTGNSRMNPDNSLVTYSHVRVGATLQPAIVMYGSKETIVRGRPQPLPPVEIQFHKEQVQKTKDALIAKMQVEKDKEIALAVTEALIAERKKAK